MQQFPLLKTGAVAQYPIRRLTAFSTRILRYLDGSEQRFRLLHSPIRKWVVNLSLLDESEIAEIQKFYASLQGDVGRFEFTDPWTGIVYANCSLEMDELKLEYTAPGQSRGTLVVRQNR